MAAKRTKRTIELPLEVQQREEISVGDAYLTSMDYGTQPPTMLVVKMTNLTDPKKRPSLVSRGWGILRFSLCGWRNRNG
jgi:hypothetical protein